MAGRSMKPMTMEEYRRRKAMEEGKSPERYNAERIGREQSMQALVRRNKEERLKMSDSDRRNLEAIEKDFYDKQKKTVKEKYGNYAGQNTSSANTMNHETTHRTSMSKSNVAAHEVAHRVSSQQRSTANNETQRKNTLNRNTSETRKKLADAFKKAR